MRFVYPVQEIQDTTQKTQKTKKTQKQRRAAILKEVPHISQFFGTETKTKYIAIAATLCQLALAVYASKLESSIAYALLVYFVGASLSQTLFLLNHELAHNLAFRSEDANMALAFIVNFPAIFPYVAAFKKYHLMHHAKMGVVGTDTDIPTEFEARLMSTFVGRAIWLSIQLVAYAVRPLIVHPLPIDCTIAANMTSQVTFNIVFASCVGPAPYKFLAASMLVSGSWHPCAMHFLSEHMCMGRDVTKEGKGDTFDFVDTGIFSPFTLNVCHHNLHHDFTRIPWSRLPKAQKLLSDYYDAPHYKGWSDILFRFLANRPLRTIS